jgi:hypothetical protein
VRKSTIAALAFDLVCAGWATFPDADVKSDKRLPIAMTLRIDLENRRWCQSPCRSTSPIADVSATEIILSAKAASIGQSLVLEKNDIMNPLNAKRSNFQVFLNSAFEAHAKQHANDNASNT